jgi:MarR family transcriptional regulator, temperature-dependent positive regulator of motility
MSLSKERQEELNIRVMRLLEERPQASQRELAAQLGVSLGGVNYCLQALVEVGWVKLGNFARAEKKSGYIYKLTPKGISEKARLTSKFLTQKMEEYEELKQEIELLQREVNDTSKGTND